MFLKIIKTFIPNKIVSVSSKDSPWVTPEVKAALRINQRAYRAWIKNGSNSENRHIVNQVQNETNHIIVRAKSDYISDRGKKVSDPKNGQKVFWSAYNRLVNKKKITNIPPLLENGSYIFDLTRKQRYLIITLLSNVNH